MDFNPETRTNLEDIISIYHSTYSVVQKTIKAWRYATIFILSHEKFLCNFHSALCVSDLILRKCFRQKRSNAENEGMSIGSTERTRIGACSECLRYIKVLLKSEHVDINELLQIRSLELYAEITAMYIIYHWMELE